MPQRVSFNSFGGGINDNTPATQIEDNQIVEALNLEFDKHSNLRTRPGVQKLNKNSNLLLRTEEFDNAAWTKVKGTIIANFLPAPDGTNTTDLFSSDGTGNGRIYQTVGNIGNNQKFVYSIYVDVSDFLPAHVYGISIKFIGGATPIEYAIDVTVATVPTYVTRAGCTAPTFVNITHVNVAPGFSMYKIDIGGTNNATGNTSIEAGVYVLNNSTCDLWGAQLTRGVKVQPYFKNISTAFSNLDVMTSKITSIYQFKKEDGTSNIYVTSGNKIYKYDSTNRFFTNVTGGLSLPNDTYWQWATYKDTAYLVNRATTASGFSNPIKIDSAFALSALGGSPPKSNFIEVWNSRIWLVSADDPSVLQSSALGNGADYTTTGKAGSQSYDIGIAITGIKAYKDRLIIFTEDTVQYIYPGSPNTDIEQYERKVLSPNIGCISAYSIQALVDDLVFLSKYGIASLAAVQQYGDFESSILSQNLAAFDRFSLGADNSASVVIPSKSQYLLSIPLGVNNIHDHTFVLDFTNLQKNSIGFTTANGLMLGSAFGGVIISGDYFLLIGGYPDIANDSVAYVYYSDETSYNDDTSAYTQRITTKAHDLGLLGINKIFYRTLFDLNLLSENVSLTWSYKINEKTELMKAWTINLLSEIISGAQYDNVNDGFDDNDLGFAVLSTPFKSVQRRIIGAPGRIGQSIQFILEITVADSGIIFKNYSLDIRPITSRRLVG